MIEATYSPENNKLRFSISKREKLYEASHSHYFIHNTPLAGPRSEGFTTSSKQNYLTNNPLHRLLLMKGNP